MAGSPLGMTVNGLRVNGRRVMAASGRSEEEDEIGAAREDEMGGLPEEGIIYLDREDEMDGLPGDGIIYFEVNRRGAQRELARISSLVFG